MYLPRERSPEPSACTVGWSRTRLFTRKLATVNPLLVPAATLEEGGGERREGGVEMFAHTRDFVHEWVTTFTMRVH